MSTLRINLLGEPEISYAGQPLNFSTRKVLALFMYVVVERTMHRREKLATLFWPESDSKSAKAALRTTLSRLRSTLQIAETPLFSEGDTVGFDFDSAYDLDLERVTEAQKSDQPAALHKALQVYRGDFLTAFSLGDAPDFDDWVSMQREAWRQRLDTLFDRLSMVQLNSGNSTAALITTQRWLAHDPLHELAYCRLMQLYSLKGNRTAVLETYERCKRVFADELGIEPSPKTVELFQRLKELRLPIADLRLKETKPNRESEIPKGHSVVNPKLVELPLAGRATVYARSTNAYRQKPHLVVLEGEAGIGKTRLAVEFLSWATLQGADVLKGRAFEMGGRLAYQPLIDALRERLEHENAPEDLLDDVWLAELSRILPELRERYPDLPPYTSDESLAQSRLFESVARLGEALSERQPVVLFIDDVQWTDDASRDLLHYLWRRWYDNKAAILLLLTTRIEDLSAEPELRVWLTSLEGDMAVSRLSLLSLTIDDTVQLVEMLADHPTDQTNTTVFAQWLFQETNGHPFFIDETLKALSEEEIIQTDDQGVVNVVTVLQRIKHREQMPIPTTMRDAILTRLERLDPAETALLIAATVLGHDCGFELLQAVPNLDEAAALAALDTLLARRLLVERPDTRRPYVVAHDKIREVVYTEAGEARRQTYHRRALQILENRRGTPAEMAHHALAGHLEESAFRHSVSAGDEAMQVYAYTEAIAHFNRALRLVEHIQVESTVLNHLYLRLGRAFEVNAQFDQALSTYEDMKKLAQALEDRTFQLAALAEQAKIYSILTPLQNAEQGQTLSEQALALAREFDDKLAEAKILWNLAILNLWGGGILKQAVTYAEQALALARQLDQKQLTASILSDLIQALYKTGQLDRAETLLQECRELDDGSINFVFEGVIYYYKGEFERVINFAATELTATKNYNNLWAQAITQFFVGRVFMEMGRPDKAIETIKNTLQIAEKVDCTPMLVISGGDLGWVYALLGKAELGYDVVEQTIQLANQHVPRWRTWPLAAMAQLHISVGNLAEAETIFEDICLDYDWKRLHPGWMLEIDRTALELAAAQNRYDLLLTLADETLAHLQQLTYRAQLPEVLWRRGQALFGLNRTTEAIACLQEARIVAETMGSRRLLWQILAVLAEAEESQGNENVAINLRDEAHIILDYIIEHIPESKLRATFTALPEVKAII